MDESALNKSHQLYRQAEHYEEQHKFDESNETHMAAIKHLEDALKLTSNTNAIDSIELQIKEHRRQIRKNNAQKAILESLKLQQMTGDRKNRDFDRLTEKMAKHTFSDENLQLFIANTMNIHDSLIDLLDKRENSNSKNDESEETNTLTDVTADVTNHKKHVTDATLIEEFRGLSTKLRDLVQILMSQLEEKDMEILKLKQIICKLEASGEYPTRNFIVSSSNHTTKNSERNTSSSMMSTPSYVLSPTQSAPPHAPQHSIAVSQTNNNKDNRTNDNNNDDEDADDDKDDESTLPSLAPLDMPPDFDFSKLDIKKKE